MPVPWAGALPRWLLFGTKFLQLCNFATTPPKPLKLCNFITVTFLTPLSVTAFQLCNQPPCSPVLPLFKPAVTTPRFFITICNLYL